MNRQAEVLVVGATGFTGSLVCEALRRRNIGFAIGGRDEAKLRSLSERLGGVETRLIDLAAPESIRTAVSGRKMVCACAGPFVRIGEPILATCARGGVHYVDTTGEQAFVARAVARYKATAEASGACVVPAMAYEIALADWASHVAAERLGGSVDAVAICYATRSDGGTPASRGTRRSALAQLAEGDAMQFLGGKLDKEPVAEVVRAFRLGTATGLATEVTAASFPSPEAVTVPTHTGAREVRTFMAVGRASARGLHLARKAVPFLTRAFGSLAQRRIGRSPVGPDDKERAATRFEIVVEARLGKQQVDVRVAGSDPYGLTAEIQALAAARALEGSIKAHGVVAPSVAFEPRAALAELAAFGVTITRQTT